MQSYMKRLEKCFSVVVSVLPVLWILWQISVGASVAYSPSAYNYGLMGLSVTCDFEWGLCGWSQETAPADQCDWRRQRGVAGNGWFKIQGDRTPGKDAHGFYLILDAADIPKPPAPRIPIDPDLIDSFEQPEPDEILAQQMGVASSSHAKPPLSGHLQDPPSFNRSKVSAKFNKTASAKFLHHLLPKAAALSSYPQSNRQHYNYYPPNPNYNYYPSHPVKNHYGYHGLAPMANTDTNSDTKPYDLPSYGGRGHGGPDPRDLASMPVAPPIESPFHRHNSQMPGHMPGLSMGSVPDNANPYTAHLAGPRIETPVNLTLTFWYHMRGNNLGRLTLYKKVLARPDQIIWEKSGQQSFEWMEAQVALQRGSFQLLFEGTVNPQAPAGSGYIALDDIHLDREAELPTMNAPAYVPPLNPYPPTLAASAAVYDGYIPVDNTVTVSTPSTRTITSTTPTTTSTIAHPLHPFFLPNWSISPEGYLVFPKHLQEMANRPNTSAITVTTAATTATTAEAKSLQKVQTTANTTRKFVRMTPRVLGREDVPVMRFRSGTLAAEGRLAGNELGVLDHTEISAVVKPVEEGISQSKLFIIIASCCGAAGLLALLAFVVKRGKSGFYSFVPCLQRSDATAAPPRPASSIRRPRHPPPPPPTPARRTTF